MTEIDVIEEMLSKLQSGAHEVRGPHYPPDPLRTVECRFKLEPRLRHLRYIFSVNRLLDEYTNFEFDVAAVRRGCLHVSYVAVNFQTNQKNLVRRQIQRLAREIDLVSQFSVDQLVVFGKHRYPKSEAAVSDRI